MLKTEQSEINFALGDNFLADYTGKIIRDPKIAIIELIPAQTNQKLSIIAINIYLVYLLKRFLLK